MSDEPQQTTKVVTRPDELPERVSTLEQRVDKHEALVNKHEDDLHGDGVKTGVITRQAELDHSIAQMRSIAFDELTKINIRIEGLRMILAGEVAGAAGAARRNPPALPKVEPPPAARKVDWAKLLPLLPLYLLLGLMAALQLYSVW